MEIKLDYTARPQFVPFHKRNQRFACLVCHRQAGKTTACIYDLVDSALRNTHDRSRYAYIAPFLRQAKAVAWDYLRAACYPLSPLGVSANESELRIDLGFNGSQIRLYGSDNPDSLRGLTLDGVVLDEYADMDPGIGAVIGPTLVARGGWQCYIGTPRGHNDFYQVWRKSQSNDDWFSLMLRASETGLISEAELDIERRNRTESDYLQEYECDFEAAVLGAYFGRHLADAQKEGRISGVPYDRAIPVWTAWDIGFRDATAVWFAQIVGREVHLIDYYEATETDVADDVRILLDKPYRYAGHILPMDAFGRLKAAGGKTFADVVSGLGLRDIQQVPDHKREDGIAAAQLFLSRCWFDADKCDRGIECLKMYRANWDDKLKIFSKDPRHDFASHAADAFRYLAMTIDGVRRSNFNKDIKYPKAGLA